MQEVLRRVNLLGQGRAGCRASVSQPWRPGRHWPSLVKLLRYSNTIVITLQYTYDLRDERDRDMFERELKRATNFWNIRSGSWETVGCLRAERQFHRSETSHGYNKVVIKEGKRKCHTLEPIRNGRRSSRWFSKCTPAALSASQIAKTPEPWVSRLRMAENGSRPASQMLTNDHYIGMVHWNKRKTVIRS